MSGTYKYDVFISHARKDRFWAETLATKLEKIKFLPWVEETDFDSDEARVKRTTDALEDSATCALLYGKNGNTTSPNHPVWSAINERLKRTHGEFRVIQVLLPEACHDSLSPLSETLKIAHSQWKPASCVKFDSSLDEEESFHQFVLRIRGFDPHEKSPWNQISFQDAVRRRAKNALNVDWERCVGSMVVNVEAGLGKSLAPWLAEIALTNGECEPILNVRIEASSLLAALRQLTKDNPPVDSQALPLGESVSDSVALTRAISEMEAHANAPKTVEASAIMDERSLESEQYGLALQELARADITVTKLQVIPSHILFRRCESHFDDDRYWEEFVRRFNQRLTNSIYQTYRRFSIDGPPSFEIVSDLLQEIYVKILKDKCAALQRFRGASEVEAEAYLMQIAAGMTTDHLRRQRSLKRRARTESLDKALILEELRSRRLRMISHYTDELAENDVVRVLKRAFKGRNRKRNILIFLLHFGGGLTPQEIAEIDLFKLSPSSVAHILACMREEIREVMCAFSGPT